MIRQLWHFGVFFVKFVFILGKKRVKIIVFFLKYDIIQMN